MANEGVVWTQEQKRNLYAAIDIMKAYEKDGAKAIAPQIEKHESEIGTEGVLAGYNNLCATLLKTVAELMKEDRLTVLNRLEETGNQVKIID